MRMIDADAFLADESEAYMKAQIEIAKRTADKTITAERYINQLVHKKIQMLIADAPTIEPKRGRWIPVDNGHHVRCSECGRCGFACDNFCPNCGARMKGADDE